MTLEIYLAGRVDNEYVLNVQWIIGIELCRKIETFIAQLARQDSSQH
jgi:hypothetical protein